jgi:hypothetical protein
MDSIGKVGPWGGVLVFATEQSSKLPRQIFASFPNGRQIMGMITDSDPNPKINDDLSQLSDIFSQILDVPKSHLMEFFRDDVSFTGWNSHPFLTIGKSGPELILIQRDETGNLAAHNIQLHLPYPYAESVTIHDPFKPMEGEPYVDTSGSVPELAYRAAQDLLAAGKNSDSLRFYVYRQDNQWRSMNWILSGSSVQNTHLESHLPSKSGAQSSSWTGILTGAERLSLAKAILPASIAAVDILISDLEHLGGNNGPPIEDRDQALLQLRDLRGVLDVILRQAELGRLEGTLGEDALSRLCDWSRHAIHYFSHEKIQFAALIGLPFLGSLLGGPAGAVVQGIGTFIATVPKTKAT